MTSDAIPTTPPNDRPRDRLLSRGVNTIGDQELLSILLGTGVRDHPALAVAEALVKAAGGVRDLEGLKAMVAAGASRVGASAGVKIVQQSSGSQVPGSSSAQVQVPSRSSSY